METFSVLMEFLVAVMKQWVFLMSGIVSISITYWERVKQNQIALRIFYIIAISCIFSSFFLAWRDEHDKYKPGLRAEILQAAFGVISELPNATIIAIMVNIYNTGDPTSIDNWRLEGKFLNGTKFTGKLMIFPPSLEHYHILGSIGSIHINTSDLLYYKTLDPIPKGKTLPGTLVFIVENIKKDQFQLIGTSIKLLFQDILKREYSSSRTVDKINDGIIYPPGIQYYKQEK